MLTDRRTVSKVNRVVIFAVAKSGMPSIRGNVVGPFYMAGLCTCTV